MLRSAPPLALLLALSACAGAAPPGEAPAPPRRGAGGALSGPAESWVTAQPGTSGEGGLSEVIPATADEVYGVLDEAYAAVGTASAGERKMGNTDFSATRRLGRRPLTEYVTCAENPMGGSMADTKPVRFPVLSTVAAGGEPSRLTTRVQAATATGERGGSLLCTSTGALEVAISRQVKLELIRQ